MFLLAPTTPAVALNPRLATPSASTATVADTGGRSILAASVEECGALLGGSGRARQVWDLLRDGVSPFDDDAGTLGRKARAHDRLRAVRSTEKLRNRRFTDEV